MRQRAALGRMARLIGSGMLLLVLAACASEQPWWAEGGGRRIEATPMEPPGRAGGYYIVRPGDSVYGIARARNVPIRSLIDSNDLRPPYNLQPGQRLVIPGGRFHVVQRGDTVYSISRSYGVDMTTLTSLNRIPPPYTIRVGERLQLPSRMNVRTASRDDVPARVPVGRPGGAGAAPAPQTGGTGAAAPGVVAAKAPLPEQPVPAGAFIWPARGKILSSFGPKENGLHNDGINIAVPAGTPVKAAQNGVVAYAGNELKGYGNLLLVRHANGWMTAYAHNSKLLVKRGDTVARGQTISLAGSSGSVTSPQVHFEVRKGSKAVDPQTVIGG